MNTPSEMSNPETWADIVQFAQEFPDTEYWNLWRSTICPLLDQALNLDYDRLFRAGSSMHHIIFSTIDHNGLRGEPHVTICVTEDWKIGIYYSTASIHFHPALESIVVDPNDAFPVFTRYLRHLWEETVPEPIPEELSRN